MSVRVATHKRFMALFSLLGAICATPVWAAHGYAEYGDLKYPAGFSNFGYLNPKAPIGGMLLLGNPDRRTSFDKFNPFTIKGTSAPGLNQLVFESLLITSWDETASGYGLLADDVAVAPDELSVTFHINPRARFSNGDRVRASDVKYSYDMLMGKGASPAYRSMTADVAKVTVVDASTIRYDFKRKNKELPLIVGGLPVFSPKWGKGSGKPDDPDGGKDVAFDKLTFQDPVASGPYVVERFDPSRGITFRRNPDYWGRDLNVRRGSFNFERIQYKLYKDETARLEAFKAGEYDAMVEYRAKNWAKSYVGVKFRSGELIKSEFPHRNGAGMQGFVMNLRRPLFQDLRVRKALALALDFEWLNRQLFYGAYRRLDSYFANSELAASDSLTGTPSKGELTLLEPLRGKLDPEVFGVLAAPPSTDPPSSLRDNLRQARRLLAQAGWTYTDGALRNSKGEPFAFEMLDDGGAMSRVMAAYARNLEKLGIQVNQRMTDFALYQKRLEEFDFDMISLRFPDSQSPGNELKDRFGSAAADEAGSDNVIGLKSPAVDALIDDVLRADNRDELITASRALDRVLMQGCYVIPHWYSALHRVAYNKNLMYPDRLPYYYSAEAWVLTAWWRMPDSPQSAAK